MSASTPNSDETENETDTDDRVTRRHIGPLLGRRRQNLQPNDAHVSPEKHTHTDANGDKIYRIEASDTTINVNLTRLLASAPSTTSNMEILRIEAQQAAEATDDELENMNPHIPSTDDVLARATAEIEGDGLAPAWEVVDR